MVAAERGDLCFVGYLPLPSVVERSRIRHHELVQSAASRVASPGEQMGSGPYFLPFFISESSLCQVPEPLLVSRIRIRPLSLRLLSFVFYHVVVGFEYRVRFYPSVCYYVLYRCLPFSCFRWQVNTGHAVLRYSFFD